MKKAIVLFIIFILLNISIAGVKSFSSKSLLLENQSRIFDAISIIKDNSIIHKYQNRLYEVSGKENNQITDFIFCPEDIELKDDAFHGADTLHFTEWWYFDAAFDNGYTAQIGIRILGLVNQGLVYIRLDIYKEGELESHELNKYLIWDFYTSEDIPLIILNGKKVMEGYINKLTNDWEYDVTLELDKSSVDLHFKGCTKGWKGSTPGGEWSVVLPRADVNGTIHINNERIKVSGIGYHDHNWDITVFTGINFGWFWGKINSDSYTMTWAKIMTTRLWGQPLLVINKKNDDYLNIAPEDIQLDITEIRIENGMLVPFSFILEVQREDISLKIDMDVTDTHHVRWAGVINYWRYHLRCKGTITINGDTESINEIQLAEFIRFR